MKIFYKGVTKLLCHVFILQIAKLKAWLSMQLRLRRLVKVREGET
jgi:hypothetical protein